MLNLDENNAPDTLAEAHDLIRELKQLNENAGKEKQAVVDHYTAKLRHMQSMFRRVLNTVYGASSEAAKSLFDEADQLVLTSIPDISDEAVNDVAPASPSKSGSASKRKKRKVLPDHLPRVDVVHDLSDAEKICKNDGSLLDKIGEEIATKFANIRLKTNRNCLKFSSGEIVKSNQLYRNS